MADSLYRRLRRILSPVHPKRLYSRLRAMAHRRRVRFQEFQQRWAPQPWWTLVCWASRCLATIYRRRREKRLTVAIDISPLWEQLTGIGWYLYRLLEHLADRDDLRLRLYGPNLINTPDLPKPAIDLPEGPALEWVAYDLPEPEQLPLQLEYTPLVQWLRQRQDRWIAFDKNRILFAPNYLLPEIFGRCRGRLVLTVHDLSFERVPWTMQEETRTHLSTHLRRNVAQAVRLITDSETVRGELIGSGIVEPDRIDAIPLGPGPTATTIAGPLPPGTPERFALHVGTLEPRKNLQLLFNAWEALKERRPEAPDLVLCGRFGWKSEALRDRVKKGRQAGWLHHFGYLPDDQVAALYQQAWLVALPSLYEGFGLPAVEAMCFGAPLLCSDIPVLREVASDAAQFAPPEDPDAWIEAVIGFLDTPDTLAQLAKRGRQRGERFTWTLTAEKTAQIWHRVAGRPAQGTEAETP